MLLLLLGVEVAVLSLTVVYEGLVVYACLSNLKVCTHCARG